jgi:hypothetical protein
MGGMAARMAPGPARIDRSAPRRDPPGEAQQAPEGRGRRGDRKNAAAAVLMAHCRLAFGPHSSSFGAVPPPNRLDLKIDFPGAQQFRWQMYFNRFVVEEVKGGRQVSFAFFDGKLTPEIVPIFISHEGLLQLRASAEPYLPGFTGIEDPGDETEELPVGARRFSPLFSNHVRLARSGGSAEIVFCTIMLTHIADVMNDLRKVGDKIPLVPVALLHSSVPVHYRFLLRVLEGISLPDSVNP